MTVPLLLALACGGRAPEPARAGRPTVLLITIDTLRADRVGGPLTPSLNALARNGTTFTAMRATAPLTLPSHATILTGLLPPEHGVRLNGVLRDPAGSTSIARVFRDSGYQTAAFVGAYVLDRRFGLSDGFDTYDDRIPRDPEAPARLEAERTGDKVAAAARDWISRADAATPSFVWVHLYDPHAPYEPPPEFLSRARGQPYDGEVMFADAQVGTLEREVRARFGSDLIVAVMGDHGEGLGEHGEATHGMLAFDSTLRVPFVLAGPGIGRGRRIDVAASLRDVAPTILAAAGQRMPARMTGRDLLATGQVSDVYAETTYPETAGWSPLRVLADDRWKLIVSSTRELYDVSRDPGERHDVAAANPGIVSAMAARAGRLFESPSSSSPGLSGEAAERLRALGYVTPSPSGGSTRSNAPNPRDRIAAWNRFETALSLISAGRSAEAVGPLRALAAQDPDARVFQSTCAQAFKNSGRTREALAIYRKLVARWPGDPTLFHDLAVSARELGYEAEALKAEQAALALDSRDANAQNGLGLLHADAGRFGDAAAAFEKATALDPNNASFRTNLGNARRALGDAAAAERQYRHALDLDPRYADAANGLGVILVQQGRAREAIDWFERALAADPRLYEAQLNLGIAYQESGNTKRAAEQYRKVLAAAPGGSRERQAARQLLAALQ